MDRIFGNGSASHRNATWEPEPTQRGTFSILSICLITLSLCVWTAVHLNIPSREERSQNEPPGASSEKWSRKRFRWAAQTFRKAGWMILGILAPELVLFTALQQFWDATALRNLPLEPRTDTDPESSPDGGNHADRKPKCTLVHGYLAAMGGFEFVTGDDYDIFPRRTSGEKRTALTITPIGLRYLANHTQVKIPKLRRSEIEDKSKGSALAKNASLPSSLLELNTFGHALCALLMYCLWWYKPLDIGEPVQIPVDEEAADCLAAMCAASKLDFRYSELGFEDVVRNSRETVSAGSFAFCGLNKAKRMNDLTLVVAIDADNELQIHIWEDDTKIQTQTQPAGSGKQRIHFQPDPTVPATESPPPFIELADRDIRRWKLALRELCKLREHRDSFSDFRKSRNYLADRMQNLPRFDGVRRSWPLYLVLSTIGFIYGGLHCLAWNAPFATNLERLLWRLSSVTVSAIGVLILLLYTWELAPPIWRNLGDSINTVGNLIYDNTWRKIQNLLHHPWDGWIKNIGIFSLTPVLLLFRALYDVSIVGFILLYCLARVYLVVECFINLAHLPDSAYLLPKWSQYVPHIA
ncbi:hypothetical protein CEP52_004258 [Fusarium oligoseptatum]|uniref:Uncharacterized protein n=1 Tax=Fusarium oligoseptatum TaxID=2604345 RepID=A0A428U4Q9_9HYPO|nr:hypothetical protein CEP52_004258 [Fusarium oligoseptatum]